MQIKKRLRINNWISLIVAVLIAMSLSWSFWEVYRTNWKENLVNKIQKTAFERIALRDDYLLNREERAGIQWHLKSEALRKLLETAAESFSSAEDKLLLQEARKNFDATFSLFSAIMERVKRERLRGNSRLIFDEAGTQQIGQVFLKSYALMDTITRLQESTMREKTKAQNRALLLIIILFVCGGIGVIVNSVLLSRFLEKRLTALNKGVEIIGNGNLDYKIALTGDDELTDLSKVMNETVAKLKQSYTSIKYLQTEISGRKQAEEALKEQALLLHISPLSITVHDESGVFMYANDQTFAMHGYTEEEFMSLNLHQLDVPESEHLISERMKLIAEKGEALFEVCHIRKDGSSLPLEVYAKKADWFGRPALFSLAKDITDRKRAESEIIKLNEELEQRIAARTTELTAKTNELERINKVFVDRELRMRELKERIAELEKQIS